MELLGDVRVGVGVRVRSFVRCATLFCSEIEEDVANGQATRQSRARCSIASHAFFGSKEGAKLEKKLMP